MSWAVIEKKQNKKTRNILIKILRVLVIGFVYTPPSQVIANQPRPFCILKQSVTVNIGVGTGGGVTFLQK